MILPLIIKVIGVDPQPIAQDLPAPATETLL